MLNCLDFDIYFRIFEQIPKGLYQTHISNFLPEVSRYLCEVPGEADPHPPRLILCCLYNQWHDICLILVLTQYFPHLLKRFRS